MITFGMLPRSFPVNERGVGLYFLWSTFEKEKTLQYVVSKAYNPSTIEIALLKNFPFLCCQFCLFLRLQEGDALMDGLS